MRKGFIIMFVAMFGLSQFVGGVTLKRDSNSSVNGVHVKNSIVIPIKKDIGIPIKNSIVIPIKPVVAKKTLVDSTNTSIKK